MPWLRYVWVTLDKLRVVFLLVQAGKLYDDIVVKLPMMIMFGDEASWDEKVKGRMIGNADAFGQEDSRNVVARKDTNEDKTEENNQGFMISLKFKKQLIIPDIFKLLNKRMCASKNSRILFSLRSSINCKILLRKSQKMMKIWTDLRKSEIQLFKLFFYLSLIILKICFCCC